MAIRSTQEHVGQVAEEIENITVDELKRELSEDDDLLLVDIREIQEVVDRGTIPGSKHVPRGMLEFWADPASPYARGYFGENKRTVLFCAGGLRSVYATKALQDMGFTNVASLVGGFGAWTKAGEPTQEKASSSAWVRRSTTSPAKGDRTTTSRARRG
jgi:rhodanese-related sulfurtransferase